MSDGSGNDPPEDLNAVRHPYHHLPNNIGYFEVPADNIDREKKFYNALLGWKIEPTTTLDPASAAALQYQQIITGPVQEGAMNAGGEADPKLPLHCSRQSAVRSGNRSPAGKHPLAIILETVSGLFNPIRPR